MTTIEIPLSHRDRAVLRAVAAGRCLISGGATVALLIDGLGCCDQFVASRLIEAGLIAAPGSHAEPAQLTETGHTLLSM